MYLYRRISLLLSLLFLFLTSIETFAATFTLSVQTNILGPTPEILGYNSGHFYPGSNTKDWWRYSGVNGARFFIPSSDFEPSNYRDSSVTNRDSFLAQRDALRTNPLKSPLIDWPAFTNRFEHEPLGGIVFGYALHEARNLNLQICAQITGSLASFPIADTNDWTGQWNFWLHCYAQAFHLARRFDVQRFQYFNEPNHPNAKGLTAADYLHRLQLASDAFQSAVADVNRLYGKSLKPLILAPVSAGSPDGLYPKWGRPLIENRHINFLGETNSSFSLLHKYDYHQYNSTPEHFGLTASNLKHLIAADTSPEPPLPLTVTEFNVHTAGMFLKMPETLDSPTIFPQLASKTINLINNSANELYLFKLSQTDWRLGVKKNGTHYVDNTNAPYNIGTITKAGEVWRLINKGFTANRQRLALNLLPSTVPKQKNASSKRQTLTSKLVGREGVRPEGLEPTLERSEASTVSILPSTSVKRKNILLEDPDPVVTPDLLACFDPATQRYYLLTANCTDQNAKLKIDFTAWNIPTSNHVLIEEVSETCSGGVRSFKPLSAKHKFIQTQPPYSVWLISLSAKPESDIETIPVSDVATLRDGKYRNTPHKVGSSLSVQNNSTNANHRSVAYLKFHLPTTNTADIQSAFLDLTTHTLNNSPTASAHIYALKEQSDTAENSSSHSALRTPHSAFTWSTTSSLAQNIGPGASYTNNFLLGVGDSAELIGQLVATRASHKKLIDITAYLKRHPGVSDLTLLLTRPIGIGFIGDNANTSALTISANPKHPSTFPALKMIYCKPN